VVGVLLHLLETDCEVDSWWLRLRSR